MFSFHISDDVQQWHFFVFQFYDRDESYNISLNFILVIMDGHEMF